MIYFEDLSRKMRLEIESPKTHKLIGLWKDVDGVKASDYCIVSKLSDGRAVFRFIEGYKDAYIEIFDKADYLDDEGILHKLTFYGYEV